MASPPSPTPRATLPGSGAAVVLFRTGSPAGSRTTSRSDVPGRTTVRLMAVKSVAPIDGEATLRPRHGELVPELLLQGQLANPLRQLVGWPEHADRDPAGEHVVLCQRQPLRRRCVGARNRGVNPGQILPRRVALEAHRLCLHPRQPQLSERVLEKGDFLLRRI